MRTELSEISTIHARWLATRQQAVAENVANAGRADYAAKTAIPFEGFAREFGPRTVEARDPARAILPSGNTVDLAREMIEGGEIGRAHSINAAVTGAFHRMMLSGAGA